MGIRISPREAISILWIIWVASWMAAAVWSDRAAKRVSSIKQVPYNILTIIGVALLFGFYRQRRHDSLILWQIGQETGWGMVAIAAAGFSFTWWARIHLGRLWSRWVVRKAHHRIIQSGPYAYVRHPIYTGLSAAVLATAAMSGTGLACLGAALIVVSFYVKARMEERFLSEELGAEGYDDYKRRVPMLVPFVGNSWIGRYKR